jgi:DNA-binding NtrC family response regulator
LASQVLVIHERIGVWARQLRPRLSDRPVRVIETRSSADLEAAIAGAGVVCPVVLLDLARRVRAGLDDLQRVTAAAPEALVLVLDPQAHEGVALLARESGAMHVMSGPATPPEVEGLLARWLGLAQRRGELDGWASAAAGPAEPEPWRWLAPLFSPKRIP